MKRGDRLSDLQVMQQRFEEICGLAIPAGATQALEEDGCKLEAVEFASLALGGEVGELMNLVKEARLRTWQGRGGTVDTSEMARETGDVLSYLLRLASAADVHLAQAYLETLLLNYFRFSTTRRTPAQPSVVTVYGPPGSGKSSVCGELAAIIPTYVEYPTENPYLGSAWVHGSGSARASQEWFLARVRDFVVSHTAEPVIVVDQDPIVIAYVYARQMWKDGLLTEPDYIDLLLNSIMLESDVLSAERVRVVVRLDAASTTLRARLTSRDSWDAAQVDRLDAVLSAFDELNSRREDMIAIDTEDLDVAQAAKAVEQHLRRIGLIDRVGRR